MCISLVYIVYRIEYFDISCRVVLHRHPKLSQAGSASVITHNKRYESYSVGSVRSAIPGKTAAKPACGRIDIKILQVTTLCILLRLCICFELIYCLHIQDVLAHRPRGVVNRKTKDRDPARTASLVAATPLGSIQLFV